MKLKKVFAGMAASAIAMSVFAMTTATEASALDQSYQAGICFQTNDTWNFRDLAGTDGTNVFPAASVGVQGGAYGNGSVEVSDATVQYDGTYTVSIATSGTLTSANNEAGFTIDADKGLTRQGSPWSMLYSYEAKEDQADDVTQDTIEWETKATTTKFNMLTIATTIPCTYEDDVAYVDGEEVTVSDVVVNMCGTEYAASDVVLKTDEDYLVISLINAYADSSIDAAALPTSDGTITATFTISGLGEDPNATSSADDTSSSGDTSSGDSTSSTSSSTSSASSTTTSSTSTTTTSTATGTKSSTGTSTTTTSTSTTTSTATSDDTANAESGASAGIALALAAVAGAAVVVNRRK